MSISSAEKIMLAARQILDADGFAGLTVAAVCARAGVSNGSFFHAFASKDALAAHLWIDCLSSYHNAMIAAVAGNPAPEEGLRALVLAHLKWVEANRPAALLMFRHVQAEWRELVRDRQGAENQRFGAALSAWRDPWVAAGRLHELSGELFAAFLIGPAQLVCRGWLDGRATRKPSASARQLADGAVRSILRAG
ncbi:TetR/AcrR family transcriptional regulator [Hyphomonas sp. WL0036]|uniref:TetR/AcrR family transcriptional regulator n=1 Tax=Hyphomonas sediminis TaxID=2866160 RepID=UPI001C810901|nr:TetR/AcrR family transcriptional regulator [Hyphomonas sediminis]MBY9068366.1 TetR/AcrR family transcriptional regulator [Hyphomonas sediminis]